MITKDQDTRILENFERTAHTIKILQDLLLCSKIGTDTLRVLKEEIDAIYAEYKNIKKGMLDV